MSISPVSFNSGVSQSNSLSSANSIQQTFKQLAKSLQSGDLTGAQNAFSNLQQLLQSGQSGSPVSSQQPQPASTRNNPIATDLAALGQALSSGDLSTAQSDFSKLQNDLQTASQGGATGSGQGVGASHHHGHHHRAEPAAAADSTDTTDSTATNSTTSTNGADSQSSTGGSVSLYA
jgi:hypothetical protein